MAYGGAFYARHHWRHRVYRSHDTIAAAWGGSSWRAVGSYPYGAAARKWAAVANQMIQHNAVNVFPAYTDFGEIERVHNEADFSRTPASHFETILRTANAAIPARARLFNVTDNVVVSGSQVLTVSTTPVRLRSPPMALPVGEKLYKAQFGT